MIRIAASIMIAASIILGPNPLPPPPHHIPNPVPHPPPPAKRAYLDALGDLQLPEPVPQRQLGAEDPVPPGVQETPGSRAPGGGGEVDARYRQG